MSTGTYPQLYAEAFKTFGNKTLWFLSQKISPTPEDALVVAQALRRKGGNAGNKLAEQLEKLCSHTEVGS